MIDFDDLESSEIGWREADVSFRAQRCARERARPPLRRPRPGGGASEPKGPGDAVGIFYGVRLPRSGEELVAWGVEWLSEAFHAAGTVASDVDVASVRGARHLGSGLAYQWLLLEVGFRPSCGALHCELLVKLPSPQDDQCLAKLPANAASSGSPALCHGGEEAFAEINSYRLFEGACPFCMPRYYFGDMCDTGSSFLLITEWTGTATESSMVRAFPARSLESPKCLLENFHGRYLATHNDIKGSLFNTAFEVDKATWFLKLVPGEHRRYSLEAWTGKYLATSGGDEQDFFMSCVPGEQERWTLVPVLGEPERFFLRSCYGTNVACLDDNRNTLYMSPNTKDWEKWRRVPLQPEEERLLLSYAVPGHLDFREASLDLCDALVRRGAVLAGMHKSGQLGPPGDIDNAFGTAACGGCEALPGLGQDHAFVDQAMSAKDFVQTIAKQLFPPYVLTSAFMKGFRGVLVTAKQNPEVIQWWCRCRQDYVALGPDLLALDSAFVSPDPGGDPAIGLSSWAHVSVGSLGWKIWGWLSSADHRVLEQCLDSLLWLFIITYQQNGGPLLDLELLRAHFFMAVLASLSGLLEALPEMYRLCPREEWASIACLGDRRLARRMSGGSWLWQHAQRFVNAAVIIEKYKLAAWLETTIPVMFGDYAGGGLSSESFTGCLVKASGAKVFAEPTSQAGLLSCLRSGLLTVAVTQSGEHEWVRVVAPVPGWVCAADLEPRQEIDFTQAAQEPDFFMLSLMYHTRRQFTGYSPRHRCFTSTSKLIDELWLREKHEGLLERLGHGKPRSRMGSFLAEERPRSWWPPGYQSWAHHTFLVFEDGTVADITADQWDSGVPQVWWPGDARRYRTDTRESDASRAARRQFGVKRWRETELREEGDGVTRTRQRWIEVERSHGETSGRP